MALISAIFLLPIFTANETGFKRAPLQVLQGFWRIKPSRCSRAASESDFS